MVKKLAIVTCKFCKKQFDRERLPFVQIPTGKVMRYAHPDCYKQAKENKLIDGEYEITDPTDSVMCAFCNKPLKRSSINCKEVAPGRFMHLACFALDQAKEKTPEEKLMDFLMNNCRYDFVPANVQKQIKRMIDQSGFTYSGIHGTLKYWWIIKGKNIDENFFFPNPKDFVATHFPDEPQWQLLPTPITWKEFTY